MSTRTAPLVLSALLAAAPSAYAQLYKWIDDSGGVNYGDSPPADAKDVKAVGPVSLSVIPGMPREELAAMRERDEQRRMAQLQRDELEDARSREKANAQSPWPPEDYVAASSYGYAYGPLAGYGPPRDRLPAHRRPRPKPAPSILPMEPLPLGEPSILRGR